MKFAMFTDIHWGCKNNSILHNEDCSYYIDWFITQIKKDRNFTHIAFLGDWFENRNAINVQTLNYSYEALDKLNNLGLPIYFIIGNHDLYHRENRKVFSTKIFEEFDNVILINEPTKISDELFLCPFIFKDEYPKLVKYNDVKYWMGHFEFRNFIVTGSDKTIDHGPDHKIFNKPKYIFSGHFHKRQANDNIIYIGNTFPTNYGDAGDDERGMTVFDTSTDEVKFIDWEECPKYRKSKLSDVLEGNIDYPAGSRVRCTVDTDILYTEAQALKEELIKSFNLREFSLEESKVDRKEAIAGSENNEETIDLSSLNNAVIYMLKTGINGTTNIDSNKLVQIYERL